MGIVNSRESQQLQQLQQLKTLQKTLQWVDPNMPRNTDAPVTTAPIDVNKIGFTCTSNEDCMNLDSFSSTPGNPVYSCPSATCNSGVCSCEPSCKLDKYSGTCCQGLEKIGSELYCIENTAKPTLSNKTELNDSFFWFIQ